MTNEKYLQTQITILKVAKIINDLDIKTFIACINAAQTKAPLLEPTMQKKAERNLGHIKKLAENFLPLQNAFEETYKAIVEPELDV